MAATARTLRRAESRSVEELIASRGQLFGQTQRGRNLLTAKNGAGLERRQGWPMRWGHNAETSSPPPNQARLNLTSCVQPFFRRCRRACLSLARRRCLRFCFAVNFMALDSKKTARSGSNICYYGWAIVQSRIGRRKSASLGNPFDEDCGVRARWQVESQYQLVVFGRLLVVARFPR